jgi:hypothetical protein
MRIAAPPFYGRPGAAFAGSSFFTSNASSLSRWRMTLIGSANT